jgi:aerobic carbon-monoxide dehydrogenase small subunit
MKKLITLIVNNTTYEIAAAANRTLAQVLREDLGLLGTKIGCGIGDCGACTVILNGRPVSSCLVLAVQANGGEITTIEGVMNGPNLHPIQQAFVDHGAVQCGFCTPGMILSAKSLLEKNPRPTELETRAAISGNLCRCTGYQKIVEAIQAAGKTMKK